jgi:SAM-dependent methyltransferase
LARRDPLPDGSVRQTLGVEREVSDNSSYGEAFADVYDEWYADVSDVDATVRLVTELAGDGRRVLELGVGTGRLAIPLAVTGLAVTGIDASPAMLDRLRARDVDGRVTIVAGDMVTAMPAGPFDVVLVAYNTLFNLTDRDAQAACFEAVARRLAPGGSFVVEAFVPDPDVSAGHDVTVKSMTSDVVVLSVSDHDPSRQRTSGHFVELRDGSVRLRPWSIRWSPPAELDAMAAAAGLVVRRRAADMAGTPFDATSATRVAVYGRAGDDVPGQP